MSLRNNIIISVVCAAIYFLIPFIKSKMNDEKFNMQDNLISSGIVLVLVFGALVAKERLDTGNFGSVASSQVIQTGSPDF